MKLFVSTLFALSLFVAPSRAQFTQSDTFDTGFSRAVAFGDLNGDSNLDIFVANTGGTNAVWLGDGTGNVTQLAQPNFAGGTITMDVALGDLDGDGDLDAVTVNAFPNNFNCNTFACESNNVWFNDGTGVFTLEWTDGLQGGSQDVEVADMNGDGWLDIIVANVSGSVNSQIYLSGGVVATVFQGFTPTNLAIQSSEVEVAHIAGSTLPDMIFNDGFTGASSSTFTNTSSGGILSWAAGNSYGPKPSNVGGLVVTDVNGDLLADIVAGSSAPATDNGGAHFIHTFLNNGSGAFGGAITSGSDGEVRFDISAGDVDGDGNVDIMVGGFRWAYGGPFNAIAYGDGTGAFPDIASGPVGNRQMQAADMNGDGQLDLITVTTGGLNAIHLNGVSALLPLQVVNTNDGGPGSLRAAMTAANANANGASADVITFNIPGAGPHTIFLDSALPNITEAALINGYSQPGSAANTATGFNPINADIRILINALGIGSGNGIRFTGHSGSEMRGLVVYGSPSSAVDISGGGHKIKGNFLGQDGVNVLGNGGIHNGGGTDDEIGGPNPADRNIIMGAIAQEPGVNSPLIQGNYLGLKASGTEIFSTGRSTHNISSNQATFVEVRNNVLAGATWRDLSITHANANQGSRNWSVINNRIGTDYTGTTTLPSGTNGIYVQKGAHDNLFQDNVIAGHSGAGILITQGDGLFSPLRNQIRQNSMFANGNPGIDLRAHSSGGIDSNDGILTPTITSATINFSGQLEILVSGGRNGIVEVFEADSQNQEGERLFSGIGYSTAPAPLGIVVPSAAGSGIVENDRVIVTLTDAVGNTSEFSAAVQVTQLNLEVTNANDSGAGSLRAAMTAANATANGASADIITFNIAGIGPHIISLGFPLPVITEAVVIDGFTQPGSSSNTLAFADGDDAVHEVVLDGQNSITTGIDINSGGSTIRGLSLTGFNSRAFFVRGAVASGNIIVGNKIISTPSATNNWGVWFWNSANNNRLGGLTINDVADRNVIGGHWRDEIVIEANSNFNTVSYNYIGVKPNGTEMIGTVANPALTGVAMNNGVSDNVIKGNLISGFFASVSVNVNGHRNEVRDNLIGTNAAGTAVIGNLHGIQLQPNAGGVRVDDSIISGNTIAGVDNSAIFTTTNAAQGTTITGNRIGLLVDDSPAPNNRGIVLNGSLGSTVQGNTIAYNTIAGVQITGNSSGNIVNGNSLFNNGGRGIEQNGVNAVQVAPTIYSVGIDHNGALSLVYEMADAQANFFIELFETDSDGEEGKTLVASSNVVSQAGQLVGLSFPDAASRGIQVGDVVVMAVTNIDESSEFTTQSAVVNPPGEFVVRTTVDSGPNSLRYSILAANLIDVSALTDRITFDIQGAGPHVISPATSLPAVTQPVHVDGYSQPGASPTTTSAFDALNADITIRVDGSSVAGGDGFTVSGPSGSSISGLMIFGFPGRAIALNSQGHSVRGNFIGTDGFSYLGNGSVQVNSSGNTIGGPNPADRNLIAGGGIGMEPAGSSTLIQGNFIGTNAAGTAIIGIGGQRNFIGIGSNQATDVTVLGNVISGSQWYGIEIAGNDVPATARNWVVQNNRIGTDRNGTRNLGNGRAGIYLQKSANDNTIHDNIIAFNGEAGVIVTRGDGLNASVRNSILGNSMFLNVGGGIELQPGGNNDQLPPLLTSAVRQASNLGFLSVGLGAGLTFPVTLEFFAADSLMREGETFLGSRTLITPTSSLDLTISGLVSAGDWILATATDPLGNTSEFSGLAFVTQAVDATILADQFIDIPDLLTFEISQDLINSVPGVTAALRAAFDSWTGVSTALASTKISLSAAPSVASAPALTDGINLITRSSDSFPLSINTLAVASKLLAVRGGDAIVVSADIVFNRFHLDNPDQGLGTDAQPGIWDVQAVATHEIGHTMGIRHSGVSTATMFFSIPSGKSYRSLELDDDAWVGYRYPSAGASVLGSIAGTISDGEIAPGTVIGGALVIARNIATRDRVHAYSDEFGNFIIPGLPAGTYTISIQPLDGFVDNIPGMVPGTVSPYLTSITDNATFTEENWSGAQEGNLETDDPAATLLLSAGENATGISFVTNLDNIAPLVNGASPTDGALGVRVDPSVSVTFSEPIIQAGLSIVLTPTAGGVSIPGTTRVPGAPSVVGTFDLAAGISLGFSTQYTIAVSGATDVKANTQAVTFTTSFTTRAEDQTPPQLLSTTPTAGATSVAPLTTISLSFSEPMDINSLKNGVTLCRVLNSECSAPLDGVWAFPNSAFADALPQWVTTFQPTVMLQEGSTYRIDVPATVRDQAAGGGNTMAAAATVLFSTVPDQTPALIEAGPLNGSPNVSVRTSVFADFSEPMVLQTDGNGSNIGVTLVDTPSGITSGPVAGTVELLDNGKRVIFRPDAPLVFNEEYVASFSASIRDATNNAIQPFELTFTTAQQPTTVTVATVSPLVSIPGSVVAFSGSGFSAIRSQNSIVFSGSAGALPGEIVSSTLSSLIAIVPDGAVGGPVTITSGGQSGVISLEIYQVIPLVDPAIARRTAESAPRDVQVTPDGGTAFVTNSGSGTVSVLDVRTGATVASLNVGDSPLKVALSPDGTRAYVTNFGSNDVAVIDVSDVNNPILLRNIPVGLNPFGLAVSPDGKRLYVAEYTSRKITIIDIEEGSSSANRAIARIGVEINARNVQEEPDGGTRIIGVDSNPRDIEISPDGGSLFFTTETLGLRVLLLDANGSADQNAATRRITAESSTRDVEVSPDGGLVFVTTLAGALEAYRIPPDLNSTSSFQAVARLGKESNSRQVEVSPDGGLIYVTNFGAGLVQVYSVTSLYTPSSNSATGGFSLTFEPVTAYSVGDNPEAVVFSAAAQVALVVNSGSNDVTVISFEEDIPLFVDSDGDGLSDAEELLLGTDPNLADTDGDLSPDNEDLLPLDPTEWFHIDGVHDTRETIVAELTTLLEELTGAPVVIPEEKKDDGKSKKSGKSGKGSKKSGKSSKFEGPLLADGLLQALTYLSFNTDSTKWVNTLHLKRERGDRVFKRDKDAVKMLFDIRKARMEFDSLLTSMIDRVVDLDFEVAELTVNEADAACDNSKKCLKDVSKARKDLEKALADLDKNKPANAIDKMRNAWKKAIKFVPQGTGKGNTREVVGALADDVLETLPIDYELGQSYPNPFNPITTIEFALPQAENVSLIVYDVLGREVEVLLRGSMEAGRHRVRFDATRLPSGVYLYRLSAGSFARVGKMILLK